MNTKTAEKKEYLGHTAECLHNGNAEACPTCKPINDASDRKRRDLQACIQVRDFLAQERFNDWHRKQVVSEFPLKS